MDHLPTLAALAMDLFQPPFLMIMSNALEQKQLSKLALISIPMTALHMKGFGLPAMDNMVKRFFSEHYLLILKNTSARALAVLQNLKSAILRPAQLQIQVIFKTKFSLVILNHS